MYLFSDIRHPNQAHLKYLEKCPQIQAADTKTASEYSWHNDKETQKSEPRRDGDAETPAQQVVNSPCKWRHAVIARRTTETLSFRESRLCCLKPCCLKSEWSKSLSHWHHLANTAQNTMIRDAIAHLGLPFR